jgi:hypothetical protein
MASDCHQWLLLWAARRMSADGFVLGGFEAPARQAGFWNALPAPFQFHGSRPDTWGIRPQSSEFAFGEAKTASDIDTPHTRAQLKIFGFTRMKLTGARCRLYLSVPRSACRQLDRVLIDLGLIGARHIVRLHIPDALLQESVNARPTPSHHVTSASNRRNAVFARQPALGAVR